MSAPRGEKKSQFMCKPRAEPSVLELCRSEAINRMKYKL